VSIGGDDTSCRAALTFVCTSVEFELERRWQQAQWRLFLAKVSAWTVSQRSGRQGGECRDAIAAEASAELFIQSSVSKKDIHFWRASLTFPEADQLEAPLAIRVDDAKGRPVQDGVFILFGVEIPIIDGMGGLTRAQLAEFHEKGGSTFRWGDGSVVSGAPVLNT